MQNRKHHRPSKAQSSGGPRHSGEETNPFGNIDSMRAVFRRSYAAEPDVLILQLRKDESIAEADTLLSRSRIP